MTYHRLIGKTLKPFQGCVKLRSRCDGCCTQITEKHRPPSCMGAGKLRLAAPVMLDYSKKTLHVDAGTSVDDRETGWAGILTKSRQHQNPPKTLLKKVSGVIRMVVSGGVRKTCCPGNKLASQLIDSTIARVAGVDGELLRSRLLNEEVCRQFLALVEDQNWRASSEHPPS